MSSKRYAEEFTIEAGKQITQRHYLSQEYLLGQECHNIVCISG
jgi:hypothetical protein